MDQYIAYKGHRIGASHKNKGLVCEDYSACYSDENIAICVISDGHGDRNCFRSAKGAEIACTVAIEVVRDTFRQYEIAAREIKRSPKRVIFEIEKSIVNLWNERVLLDAQIAPFSENEYIGLDENVVMTLRTGQKRQKVYGCTLVMGVIIKDFWFAIQIGDGKCVVCQANGLYEQPIPQDNEGCVGNRSTSLCNTYAIDAFRYCYSKHIPAAIFVMSDGIDESFDENGLNKCCYSIALWLTQCSQPEYAIKMEELLEKISYGGSGDDVSVSCIIRKQLEVRKPYATSAQVADKMDEMYGMLKDAEHRYSELKLCLEEISQKEEDLIGEIQRMQRQLEEKRILYEERKKEKKNLESSLRNLRGQLGKLSEQFMSAKETKKRVDEYWTSMNVSVTDNSTVMEYVPVILEDRDETTADREKIILWEDLFKK